MVNRVNQFKKVLLFFPLSISLFTITSVLAVPIRPNNDDPWLSFNIEDQDDCHRIEQIVSIPDQDLWAIDQKFPIDDRFGPADSESQFLQAIYNLRMKIKKATVDKTEELSDSDRFFFFGFPIKRMVDNTNKASHGNVAYARMAVENFIVIPLFYIPSVVRCHIPINRTLGKAIGVPTIKAIDAVYLPLKKKMDRRRAQFKEYEEYDAYLVQQDSQIRDFFKAINNNQIDDLTIREVYLSTQKLLPAEEQEKFTIEIFFNSYLKRSAIILGREQLSFEDFKENFSSDFAQTYRLNKNLVSTTF